MRSWLSLFFLAPTLFAQAVAPALVLPANSDALQQLQQRFDGLTPAPAGQGNFWHFQARRAPKVLAGNPVPHPIVIAPKPMKVGKVPTKTCSVPLTNVLKGKAFDEMAVPLSPSKGFFTPGNYVTPPAPPCDDEKR
ncbi:MAG TPA: hypothetical protein VLW65_01510 [Bryobacteraceae bacterium]|nr:hypothetical protein [Bryobacteraceae bacterium]